MIGQIDQLRLAYIRAVGEAIVAHGKLTRLDNSFKAIKCKPSPQAIEEMNTVADAAINALAEAQAIARNASTYINVGGDMVQVGDITDSDSIAIGKDIDQDTTTSTPMASRYRVKHDKRFKPPGAK